MSFKHFGSRPSKEDKKRYALSPNFRGGRFNNLIETNLDIPLTKFPSMIYQQMSGNSKRAPEQPLPVKTFDAEAFLQTSDNARMVWYGHSAVLMRMANKTIFIDPMLGHDTTPIAPMATRRYSEGVLDVVDDLPNIDLVFISHDHYDHLDYDSISKLKSKTSAFVVALGVKRHLVGWGVDAEIITEMDWWQTHSVDELDITFTPTRHFSGRGITP